MVHTWAPLVWLHSGEQFMPSSVEFFLEHVTLQDRKGRLVDAQPSAATLPGGPNSAPLRLQSKQKLGTSVASPFFLLVSIFVSIAPRLPLLRGARVLPRHERGERRSARLRHRAPL